MGQKMLFCTNFAPVDLYVWSSIVDIMMLGLRANPPSRSSLPPLHFLINHCQSSSPLCPNAAHAPQPSHHCPLHQQQHCDLHPAGCNEDKGLLRQSVTCELIPVLPSPGKKVMSWKDRTLPYHNHPCSIEPHRVWAMVEYALPLLVKQEVTA